MAANINPIFSLLPVVSKAAISAANTARDGTGTIVQVVVGGTNGTRIERIVVEATGTTAAGIVALYIDPNTGTYYLWKEVLVTAITPSTTVAAFAAEFVRSDGLALINLPPSYKIGASPEIANTFNVIAEGGDY